MTIGLQETGIERRRSAAGRLGQAGSAVAFGLIGFAGLIARNWWHRRQLRRLYDFTPRELADIGIDRQDLHAAYYGSVHDNPGEILNRRAAERRRAERDTLRERHRLMR